MALLTVVHLSGLSSLPSVLAERRDYAAPAAWLLPWQSGETYHVTWGPRDHWTHGKATGIAFDFALPHGVPIFAPADGVAHYALDNRPLSTTLGNYVDLQTADGWLIRMAHLRDHRVETREVVAGELLGYAGASGVSASHLHVELLVFEDGAWRCPDPDRLVKLFGRPIGDFEPGALVINGGCTGMLVSGADARTLTPSIRLGEAALMLLPLRNEGERPLDVTSVQLVLESPIGETVFADAEGLWRFPARSLHTLALHVHADLAGVWEVRGVRYTTADHACALSMGGRLLVEGLPVALSSLAFDSSATIGAPVEVAVTLRHTGEEPLEADDLLVWGKNPSGGRWQATLGEPVRLDPGQEQNVPVRNGPVLDQVGVWLIDGVALVRNGRAYRIALHSAETTVSGPQLVMEGLEVFPSGTGGMILARVVNLGDQPARDVRVEVWGWHGDAGGEAGNAQARIAFLEPGRSTVLRLVISGVPNQPVWRLVGAGYWLGGNYVPMSLPDAPQAISPEIRAGGEG